MPARTAVRILFLLTLGIRSASMSGQESAPATPDVADRAAIEAALLGIDAKAIEADIRRLVAFGTRHALSPQGDPNRGAPAAARWILAEFEKAAQKSDGRMSARLHAFDPRSLKGAARFIPDWWKEKELENVVAEIKGSEPGRIIIVSGHYDSRVSERFDAKSDAPGANDDGSGTAVVLAMARALAPIKTRATIWLVAFTAEEMQLWGSQALARDCDEQGLNIEAVLNNDIVGGARNREPSAEKDVVRLFSEGRPQATAESHARFKAWAAGESESDSPSREWARYVADVGGELTKDLTVRLVFRLDRFLRGGDHRSFHQLGYAAARLTEAAENYDLQHQNVREEGGKKFGDLPDRVDFDYVAKVARLNAAAVLSAASAPAPPVGVAIDAAQLMNETRLVWKASNDASIKGYRVLLRRTHEATWTSFRDVGLKNDVQLAESKDDFLFAVQAIDHAGRRSIPTFAGVAGRTR